MPPEILDYIFHFVLNRLILQLVCKEWYECIEFLYPYRKYISAKKYIKKILVDGHLNILKWINPPHENYVCDTAVREGHLHILQWGYENCYPSYNLDCVKVAQNGHLHILKWARANDYDWDEEVCTAAAEAGHLHIVKWIVENNYDYSLMAKYVAIQKEHMDIVLYFAFREANDINQLHLIMLKWFRHNREMTAKILYMASQEGLLNTKINTLNMDICKYTVIEGQIYIL